MFETGFGSAIGFWFLHKTRTELEPRSQFFNNQN
jgi:hypothetical protein